MKVLRISLLLLFGATHVSSAAPAVLRDARSVAAVLASGRNNRETFALTGVVLRANNAISRCFALQDETGAISLRNIVNYPQAIAAHGDRIAVTGRFAHELGEFFADALTCQVLEHGPAPVPTPACISDVLSGKFDHRLVRVTGTVRDAFLDEIDPFFAFAVLSDGESSLCLSFCTADNAVKPLFKPENLSAFVGATISADGTVTFAAVGSRPLRGRIVDVSTMPTVLAPAPDNSFNVPDLESIDRGTSPEALSRMDRHRVTGIVCAVWNTTQVLLATSQGNLVNVDCPTAPLPTVGSSVDVVGLPATDLYRRNLVRAGWRPSAATAPRDNRPPTAISAREILTDRNGNPKIKPSYHGQRVRMTGTVTTTIASHGPRVLLTSDGFPVTLDATAVPAALSGIVPGCRLEMTGICIIETETWQAQTPFPRITGLTVALTNADGLKVLARPSWWTPSRFAAVAGLLLALVAGFAVWNRILRRLIDCRSRELLREQVSRTEAGLRLDERTRLAVELHDSVAQNLTGVSLQIDAADRFAATDPVRMRRHLGLASQTLLSCRDELRNCLWDLRSHALEESDTVTALQRTVQPHIGEAELRIRFPVPRARLFDQTMHTILRIIRELAVNAFRHGRASVIKIAGSLDDEHLLFSVEDNGSGFDPASAPGVKQGHFGLQGIRERIRALNGKMAIESHPGRGTYVSVSLPRAPLNEKDLDL